MENCKKYIEQIYCHSAFNTLISKVKPIELQDDLRQEVAVILLTKDCEQIERLYHADELLQYSLRIVWTLATSKNTRFYRIFKKNEIERLIEYSNTLQGDEMITDEQIKKAKNILSEKLNTNANAAHESILFSKYVELSSGEKVAEFFGIPALHCYEVIRKTKNELKKAIRNDI